jgi:hypothetical protein
VYSEWRMENAHSPIAQAKGPYRNDVGQLSMRVESTVSKFATAVVKPLSQTWVKYCRQTSYNLLFYRDRSHCAVSDG